MQLTAEVIEAVDSLTQDEDVRQDVYVKLLELENPPELKNKTELRKWIATVCFHHKVDTIKAEARRQDIEETGGSTLQVSDADTADPMEYLTAEELVTKIDDLSPLLYDTLSGVYIDGLTPAELAKDQDVTEDVIYKRISRARDALLRG